MGLLTDGYQTLITLTNTGNAGQQQTVFKEREGTPPAVTLGGPIDTHTMRNKWRMTKAPKHLYNVDASTFQVQYDPVMYLMLITGAIRVLGLNQEITITFPDGRRYVDWGWVEDFKPTGHKHGDFPLAELKIEWSGTDSAGNEVKPRLLSAA